MARRPRKETTITDEMLLALIVDGTIVIDDIHDANPVLRKKNRVIKAELTRQAGRNYLPQWSCERWTWRISIGGERRRIVRAKLVWMFWTKTVVPPGCAIHHGEGGRFDDSIDNLVCWTDEQHKAYHYGSDKESEF